MRSPASGDTLSNAPRLSGVSESPFSFVQANTNPDTYDTTDASAVGSDGSVYVVGTTTKTNATTVDGEHDFILGVVGGFLAKYCASGTRLD